MVNDVTPVAVPIEVGEGFGVIRDHGVEVEGLRVGEVGVGDGDGDVGPIGAEPAAEAVGIVARAEVVVAGFRVALLALELVIVLEAGVGVRSALAAAGIGVRVVADHAGVAGDDARGAEHVLGVELRGAARREQGHALAAEEDILIGSVSGAVGFREHCAARAIPIEFVGNRGVGGIGLGGAAAVAIINVGDAGGGLQLALGVPQVAVDAVVGGVAGEVVGK